MAQDGTLHSMSPCITLTQPTCRLCTHLPPLVPLPCSNPVNSTVPIAAEVLKKAGVYDKRKVGGREALSMIHRDTRLVTPHACSWYMQTRPPIVRSLPNTVAGDGCDHFGCGARQHLHRRGALCDGRHVLAPPAQLLKPWLLLLTLPTLLLGALHGCAQCMMYDD